MAETRYFLKDRGGDPNKRAWLFRLREGLVEIFTKKGTWVESPTLIRYIVRGDTDTDEITEKEAMKIVKLRMEKAAQK